MAAGEMMKMKDLQAVIKAALAHARALENIGETERARTLADQAAKVALWCEERGIAVDAVKEFSLPAAYLR